MTAVPTVEAFVVVVVSVLVAAMAAAADTVLRRLPRSRVKRLAEAGVRGSGALEALAEKPGRALGAAAFAGGLAYVASTAALGWALVTVYPALTVPWAALLGALLALVIVFCLGEALPRAVALANPEGVALSVAGPARRLFAVTYPVARLLASPWTWILGMARAERLPSVPWSSESDEAPADSDDAEYADDEAEEAIASAFSEFREKVVREVMVPRPDMICIEDTATVAETLDAIRDNGYSRLPVYHETLDDIRGVLYAKDLLLALGPDGCTTIKNPAELARPPYWVPESKPVEALLIEMRNRTHIAVVADEYGGTAGLVTIEDLLEEIVGEIFDEYDRLEQLVVDLGEERFRVDARLSVDEFNDRFGTAIEMDADTLGGLVTEIAGHIPSVGESVEVEGLRLVVDALEGARVRGLIVEPAPRAEERGNEPDEDTHPA
jgi:CBS domain containing-hemolysin-like protein